MNGFYPSKKLKDKIKSLGFDQVGIARARYLDEEAKKLDQWLTKGNHGEMSYMERYFDIRVDPEKLLAGSRSMIIMSYNYFQEEVSNESTTIKIARYARGKDYHNVILNKLKEIILWMETEYTQCQTRPFVDSAPVLERDWAKYAGISWSGKNTLSIHPKSGSYFFLCGIATDVRFENDDPIKDYCGTCRKCIDACPTQAIHKEGYLLDASKCISYLTIELKNEIPDHFKGQMENWIFGCDICQEVCPWNRFSTNTREVSFSNSNSGLSKSPEEWLKMEEIEFKSHFAESALKRTGLKGIKRNINFLINK